VQVCNYRTVSLVSKSKPNDPILEIDLRYGKRQEVPAPGPHCTPTVATTKRVECLALVGLRSKRNALHWHQKQRKAEDAGEEERNKWRAGSTIKGGAGGVAEGEWRAERRRHSMQSTAYGLRSAECRLLTADCSDLAAMGMGPSQPVRKCRRAGARKCNKVQTSICSSADALTDTHSHRRRLPPHHPPPLPPARQVEIQRSRTNERAKRLGKSKWKTARKMHTTKAKR